MGVTDKMKHKLEELTGKTKEAAGKATGDSGLRGEGQADQLMGKVKQVGDKIKDTFKK